MANSGPKPDKTISAIEMLGIFGKVPSPTIAKHGETLLELKRKYNTAVRVAAHTCRNQHGLNRWMEKGRYVYDPDQCYKKANPVNAAS
jgi:hypothetical protein